MGSATTVATEAKRAAVTAKNFIVVVVGFVGREERRVEELVADGD